MCPLSLWGCFIVEQTTLEIMKTILNLHADPLWSSLLMAVTTCFSEAFVVLRTRQSFADDASNTIEFWVGTGAQPPCGRFSAFPSFKIKFKNFSSFLSLFESFTKNIPQLEADSFPAELYLGCSQVLFRPQGRARGW